MNEPRNYKRELGRAISKYREEAAELQSINCRDGSFSGQSGVCLAGSGIATCRSTGGGSFIYVEGEILGKLFNVTLGSDTSKQIKV
jgi:hypothetical protein